jgi:hypothetical protein
LVEVAGIEPASVSAPQKDTTYLVRILVCPLSLYEQNQGGHSPRNS